MTAFNQLTAGAGALAVARKLTGLPYIYGGDYPTDHGTDCSGLVEYAYFCVGIQLPRTTFQQYQIKQIPNSEPSQPGDLLFILGSDPIGNEPGHVMMYVSPGQVFQAPFTGEKIGQYAYDTAVFEYRTRPALLAPFPPSAKPTKQELAQKGLVALPNALAARLAIHNGWPLYYWNGDSFQFSAPPVRLPKGATQYASSNYVHKNKAQ